VFVVGLKSGVDRGTAVGTDIWCHVGSQHYHLRTSTALLLMLGKSCAKSHQAVNHRIHHA
jgi:hypothetical protein